jgi:hypothetical protein
MNFRGRLMRRAIPEISRSPMLSYKYLVYKLYRVSCFEVLLADSGLVDEDKDDRLVKSARASKVSQTRLMALV